jgi:hypothetical protein
LLLDLLHITKTETRSATTTTDDWTSMVDDGKVYKGSILMNCCYMCIEVDGVLKREAGAAFVDIQMRDRWEHVCEKKWAS